MECANAGAGGGTFGNTELSQRDAQIKTVCNPELEGEGVKTFRIATP